MFLVPQLYRMAVIVRHAPRERVEKLETDKLEILEFRNLSARHHVAGVARHIEDKPVVVKIASLVLHVQGNPVAGLAITPFVDKHQVGFARLVAQLAGDVGVRQFHVGDAVGTHEVQAGVHEVLREGDVPFVGENPLEACVVVDVDVFVLVRLDDSVDVLGVLLGRLEILEKFGKFFSSHFFPFAGTPPLAGRGQSPVCMYRRFCEENFPGICSKKMFSAGKKKFHRWFSVYTEKGNL